MKLFFLSVTLSLVGIIFFEEINLLCLSFHFSWTFSKILPYLLLVFSGFILERSLRKKINHQRFKFLFQILLFILPFIIGFSFYPIYEGDFSKNGQPIVKNLSPLDFKTDGITVVAIPGCKYCFESIEKLKILKKRNPKLAIHFIVCCDNEKLIQNYKSEVNGMFKVSTSANPNELAKMAKLFFPSFIQVKNKRPIYCWSNDQFGVRALDNLEDSQE